MHFCCRKAKNSCLAPKTLIYGIFVTNVATDTALRITHFEDEDKPQVVQACHTITLSMSMVRTIVIRAMMTDSGL